MEERVRENMKREPSQIPARALMVQISESEVHPFKKIDWGKHDQYVYI